MTFPVAAIINIGLYEYAGSECEVYYLDQPINEFTCNPILSDVRLECTIYYKNDKSYDIYWYKIPMGVDTANPELVNTYRLFQHTNTRNYFGGKLIKSQFHMRSPTVGHPDAAGIYWCQVVLLDESGQASSNGSFKASSAFLLRSPEQYSSFPPCSDVYQSQPRSECARNGGDPPPSSNPPPVTSSTSPPNQIMTSAINQAGSMTDSSSNDLPPWGYAVIAGGGVASMIIITVIVCILLAFCQSLQKYKASKFSHESAFHHSSVILYTLLAAWEKNDQKIRRFDIEPGSPISKYSSAIQR